MQNPLQTIENGVKISNDNEHRQTCFNGKRINYMAKDLANKYNQIHKEENI